MLREILVAVVEGVRNVAITALPRVAALLTASTTITSWTLQLFTSSNGIASLRAIIITISTVITNITQTFHVRASPAVCVKLLTGIQWAGQGDNAGDDDDKASKDNYAELLLTGLGEI